MTEPTFPGAVRPERNRSFLSRGLRLNAIEWGDPQRQPIVLAHGMWDHARGFAVLAPLLAERFWVIALDASGHGYSSWAAAYTWMTDVRDLVNVVLAIGRRVHLVGHSKGGGQVTSAARLARERVRQVVNIDGFGPPPLSEDSWGTLPARFSDYLNNRRRAQQRPDWRPYPTLEALIERRRAQNPRLSRDWLRYFCFHGARLADDGWRWMADPHLADGFGPWRPDWIADEYAHLPVPMLAIVGSEPDTWGPLPETLLQQRLARVRHLERRTVRGAGHFVHMEKPVETAQLVLDFLEA